MCISFRVEEIQYSREFSGLYCGKRIAMRKGKLTN